MLSILLFISGLIIGSFLAAFSYRFPRNITIKKGRSFCPNCKHTIAWFDNIPVLSYLILDGKCRHCRTKISIRYPLIELLTAVIFVLTGLNYFLLLIASILILILVIDWEHMIIPDELVYSGVVIFVIYVIVTDQNFLFVNLLSGFSSALFLLFVHAITRGQGMGLGDVKLAILIGALLGFRFSPIWLLLSFLTGGIIAAILLMSKKAKLKERIAFGPFLVVGYFLTTIWGNNLLTWLGY